MKARIKAKSDILGIIAVVAVVVVLYSIAGAYYLHNHSDLPSLTLSSQ